MASVGSWTSGQVSCYRPLFGFGFLRSRREGTFRAVPVFACMYIRKTAFILVWYPGPCSRYHSTTSPSRRRDIGFFGCGILSVAFWKKEFSNSGESERSISESGMVAKRSQSVSDCLFELVAFILCCLSGRNDPDLISVIVLCEYDNSHNSLEEADSYPSLLIIFLAFVDAGEHRELEHLDSILEANAMLEDVRSVLSLIPKESHSEYIHSVYTTVKENLSWSKSPSVSIRSITSCSGASCAGDWSRHPKRVELEVARAATATNITAMQFRAAVTRHDLRHWRVAVLRPSATLPFGLRHSPRAAASKPPVGSCPATLTRRNKPAATSAQPQTLANIFRRIDDRL
jgi:hypothetical protein